MDPSVETFKAATAEYEAACDAAVQLASDLKQVGNSMNYAFNTFLELNYALKSMGDSGRYDRDRLKHRYNMSEWPDRARMDAVFGRLTKAYNTLHEVWDSIPADDRKFLRQPPRGVQLRLRD